MASAPFAAGSNPASKVGADTLPGGAGLLTAPGPKVKEPDFNPFQVYAVRDLSELGDLINETVWTPEVVEVEKAVRGFVQAYGAPSDPVPRLLLAANGDFGTGKTHLMLFARATLYKEMEQKFGSKPKTPGLSRAPFVVLAPSSEAPVEDWFATELGPKGLSGINCFDFLR